MFAFLIYLLLDLRVASGSLPASLIVQTNAGPVRGHISKRIKTNAEFLGIPFAEPPVGALFSMNTSCHSLPDLFSLLLSGPLRWKAPLPPTPWHFTRDAIAHGAACLQNGDIDHAFYGTRGEKISNNSIVVGLSGPQSEDCLTLNVWVPTSSTSRSPLPVMVRVFFSLVSVLF